MSESTPTFGLRSAAINSTVDNQRIQCCGTFDAAADEYCFTAASGGLCVSFEFLRKEDVVEMRDCLDCMLASGLAEE